MTAATTQGPELFRQEASQPATQRQLRYLQAVAKEVGYDGAALDKRAVQEFRVKAAELSRRDASTLIGLIESEGQTWNTV